LRGINVAEQGSTEKGDEPMPLEPDRLLKPLKKLRKLIRRMDRQPAPGKVHDLRTNTRRFESIFQALSLEEHGVGKSTLKDLGRLRKRAGKVRDLDVLTGFASTIHLKGEEECGVQLLENLGAQRKKHATRLYKEAIRLRSSLHKDLKHASSIVAKLLQEKASVSKADTRTADTMAAAAKLSAGLATPRQLGRKTLHPYRLKVKGLRNVLQMADSAVRSKFVDDLGQVKDAIGEWHDWEELVSIARKVLDHGKECALQGELKRIVEQKYEKALGVSERLRKTYLHNARPVRKGASASSQKVPGPAVCEATSLFLE
jgi:CHAD domain-containing protein